MNAPLCFVLALLQPPAERRMAITFDDLPANTLDTAIANQRDIVFRLVDAIRSTEVPAIGFVNEAKLSIGPRLIEERVALLQRWRDAGLALGHHGYGHLDLHAAPLHIYLADIERGDVVTRRLLAESGAAAPSFYRHPFLHTGRSPAVRDSVGRFLAARGYQVAPVTIDNGEWIFARAYENAIRARDQALARRIGAEYSRYLVAVVEYYERQSVTLFGRDIPHVLLLHANRLNADHFAIVAQRIRDRGYRFVPIEAALADAAYQSPDEYVGPSGITWLHRWALTKGGPGAIVPGEPEVASFVAAAARL
jgi:peptidoglycan/xylan/chitin deacetylase (PgdA/CDA1 family)